MEYFGQRRSMIANFNATTRFEKQALFARNEKGNAVATFTSSSNVVRIRRRTIAAKYKALDRDRRQRKQAFSLSALRLTELQRLYTARWGLYLPDDDAGRDDLLLAFHQIPNIDACIEWAAAWAPWLHREDALALAHQTAAARQWLKARALGERLGLTDAERTALNIKTARPIDVSDEALLERKRVRDRQRKARKRLAQRTAKTMPVSRAEPWKAEGISRRTWYRKRRVEDGTKPVRDNSFSITADGICATTPPAIASGTPKKSIRLVRVEAEGLVGGPSRKWKTRFPTAMRLNKEQRAYAKEAGFEPDKINRIFEMFRDHNISQRTYSPDWDQAWVNWVDREILIMDEWYDRQRQQRWINQRL
ncbi:hypothetical protein [Bradyrhizobium erythrophlei]|nr:hypothetical protein [Bradyrhizobium erythrophlei]